MPIIKISEEEIPGIIKYAEKLEAPLNMVLNEGIIEVSNGHMIRFSKNEDIVNISSYGHPTVKDTNFEYNAAKDTMVMHGYNANSEAYVASVFRGIMMKALHEKKSLHPATDKTSSVESTSPDRYDFPVLPKKTFKKGDSEKYPRPWIGVTGATSSQNKGMWHYAYQIPYRGYTRTRNGKVEFVPPGIRGKHLPVRNKEVVYQFE